MPEVKQSVLPGRLVKNAISQVGLYYPEWSMTKGDRFSALSDKMWACYNVAHGEYAEACHASLMDVSPDPDDLPGIDDRELDNRPKVDPERQAASEKWIATQFALLGAAEKCLKERTWKDYLFHPFRSIAQNIAVSNLRERIYSDNKKIPKAEMDTLAKLAKDVYGVPHGNIVGIGKDGNVVVQTGGNFQRDPETGRRRATATNTVSLKYDLFRKRVKNPDKFDRQLDKILKRQRRAEEAAESERQSEAPSEKEPTIAENPQMQNEGNAVSAQEQEELLRQVNATVNEATQDDKQISQPVAESEQPSMQDFLDIE